MEWVLLALVVAVVFWLVRGGGTSALRSRGPTAEQVAAARRTAEEDVTRFGEELRRLDGTVDSATLDDAGRQDWQRALDGYEAADRSLQRLQRPEDVRHVTEALEDGRYAVACVVARREGRPLPTRRPPCFFNPAHGPSTEDVSWAPPGGLPRDVPVCAADADRLAQGAEPAVRTVPGGRNGLERVPYWQGGPAYLPYTSGYFSPYAAGGMLPGFLLGTLVASSLHPVADPSTDELGDDGSDDGGGFDGGSDSGGGFDGGGFDGGF